MTLPTGRVFHEHDHVNYRATALDGTGGRDFSVHLEALNGRTTAAHIGASFLGFADAVATFPAGHCVTWVQVAGFDEHFGEGAQGPACTRTRVLVPDAPSVPVPDGGAPVDSPVDSPVAESSPTSSELPVAPGSAPVATSDDGLAATRSEERRVGKECPV